MHRVVGLLYSPHPCHKWLNCSKMSIHKQLSCSLWCFNGDNVSCIKHAYHCLSVPRKLAPSMVYTIASLDLFLDSDEVTGGLGAESVFENRPSIVPDQRLRHCVIYLDMTPNPFKLRYMRKSSLDSEVRIYARLSAVFNTPLNMKYSYMCTSECGPRNAEHAAL